MSCYNDTMQFVFKRDEEGRERIYVGDVFVATVDGPNDGSGRFDLLAHIQPMHVYDAIERADEAGFWQRWPKMGGEGGYRRREVTVDVPVADNAVLSVTVGGDES